MEDKRALALGLRGARGQMQGKQPGEGNCEGYKGRNAFPTKGDVINICICDFKFKAVHTHTLQSLQTYEVIQLKGTQISQP